MQTSVRQPFSPLLTNFFARPCLEKAMGYANGQLVFASVDNLGWPRTVDTLAEAKSFQHEIFRRDPARAGPQKTNGLCRATCTPSALFLVLLPPPHAAILRGANEVRTAQAQGPHTWSTPVSYCLPRHPSPMGLPWSHRWLWLAPLQHPLPHLLLLTIASPSTRMRRLAIGPPCPTPQPTCPAVRLPPRGRPTSVRAWGHLG